MTGTPHDMQGFAIAPPSSRFAWATCAKRARCAVVGILAASAAMSPVWAQDDRAIGALTRLSPELSGHGLAEDMDRCPTGTRCSSAAAQPVPSSAALAVAVRSYYADLRFDASPLRDQQAVIGNCLNQRLKIVVSDAFEVSWDIREATRVSRWRGSVDPKSGSISVKPDGFQMPSGAGGDAASTAPSEAIGDFAKSRISYGPCGGGEIVVRN